MNGYKIFFTAGTSTIVEADFFEVSEKNRITFYKMERTNPADPDSAVKKFVADFGLDLIAGYTLFREARPVNN